MSSGISVPELLLDAWPIVEWQNGREPARAAFRKIVEDSMAGLTTLSMCRINYGEVVYSVRKAFPADRAEDTLKAFREIAMQLYSVDDRLVDEAVDLKAMYSISYADASAAALTMRRGLPLVTGDAELVPLEKLGLRLHWVGQ